MADTLRNLQHLKVWGRQNRKAKLAHFHHFYPVVVLSTCVKSAMTPEDRWHQLYITFEPRLKDQFRSQDMREGPSRTQEHKFGIRKSQCEVILVLSSFLLNSIY